MCCHVIDSGSQPSGRGRWGGRGVRARQWFVFDFLPGMLIGHCQANGWSICRRTCRHKDRRPFFPWVAGQVQPFPLPRASPCVPFPATAPTPRVGPMMIKIPMLKINLLNRGIGYGCFSEPGMPPFPCFLRRKCMVIHRPACCSRCPLASSSLKK
jgi:hypothetical protein